MIPLSIEILRKGESKKVIDPEQVSELNVIDGVRRNLPITKVAIIEDGTTEGRATITFFIDLPDGKTLMAETTARLLRPVSDIASQLNGDI
jgi:hypothetical protein